MSDMDKARYEGDELTGTRMPDGSFLVERGHALWGGMTLPVGEYALILPDGEWKDMRTYRARKNNATIRTSGVERNVMIRSQNAGF